MFSKRYVRAVLVTLLAVALFVINGTQARAAASDLFFSEYIEGSSNNKALEIYNGTGATVDLTDYVVEIYFNGSTSVGTTIDLSGTVADGDVWVVADNDAAADILAMTDQQSTGNFFNGDDAILLKKSGVVIDSFGRLGEDPGSQWGASPTNTANNTLRRLDSVCAGDIVPDDVFDPAAEWNGFGTDVFDGLGSHSGDCGVTPPSGPADLLLSEYIEGTSNNKALEIYNGTGAAVDLTDYVVEIYFNGSTSVGTTIDLSGTVADGDVWVVADNDAAAGILAVTDQQSNSNFFNGDDAILLKKSGVVIDSFGRLGEDPGSQWGASPTNTANNTLRRLNSVCAGDIIPDDVFDPAAEWDGLGTDVFDGLGSHSVNCDPAPVCTGAVPIASVQGTGDATPEAGNEVTIQGLVTADFGGEIVVQENSSTARSGVVVFSSGNSASQGDEVCVTGVASERFSQTQIGGNGNPNATIDILSSGNALPAPVVLPTGSLATNPPAEDWEGVLVRVESVTVDNPDLGFGEFSVDDGSGPVRVDDLGYSFSPVANQALDFVQGPLFYTFSNYKIEPRDVGDVGLPPPPSLTCDTYPNTTTVVMVHDIQGSGATTPIPGTEVGFEGIVVGDFQNNGSPDNGHLNGFYVQEEDADADGDPATSEGIFVFAADTDVAVGDKVRVVGTATEYVTSSGASSMTQVSGPTVVICASGETLPAETSITLPVTGLTDFERYEGMLVTFPQELVISEYFNFDRFGEIVLTTDRQNTPTAVVEPGAPAIALAAEQALARITLDDGRSSQNPDPAIHPNGSIFDLTNLFRGGDLVQNATGVIDETFGLYRIQPVQGATYTAVNDRPTSPADVGGNIQVASFNVLNYFSTIDDGVNDICGPLQNQECRGADSANEFDRQRTKIFAALAEMDADVVGLIEIENHFEDAALIDLVTGLNAYIGSTTYNYIATGPIGGDAIKVAFIYKTASVTPIGNYAILDGSVDPRFNDDRNRPVLAQTFQDAEQGGLVTVAVNHLKSKGSSCEDVGDPDTGDGAGNCNITRLLAAEALVDWLATDPTGSGSDNSLIIGDLNSYDKEDPIDAILAGSDDTLGTSDDYTDLIFQFGGEFAYGYVFDGKVGYLDYALASSALLPRVTGTTEWHINADEPDILDYDTSFKQPPQQALWEPNAFRSSDHDPVIVGLDICEAVPPEVTVTVSPDELWPPNHKYVKVTTTVSATDNFDPNPTITLVDVESNEPDNGLGDGDRPNDIRIVDDYTFKLRAERSGTGDGRIYTITYEVTDACGNSTIATAEVTVPKSRRK